MTPGDILRHLAECEFVLAHEATPRERDRTAVEEFARTFWSLPPADRHARWKELSERCEGPAAAARLLHLADGLAVVPAELADPDARVIAELVRDTFVLPPRDRAVVRARWLLDPREPERWMRALEVVEHEVPDLVALDPVLANRLADLTAFLDRVKGPKPLAQSHILAGIRGGLGFVVVTVALVLVPFFILTDPRVELFATPILLVGAILVGVWVARSRRKARPSFRTPRWR